MFLIISVWVHVIAAMIWIGGMAFLTLVLMPVIRKTDIPTVRGEFLQLIARRFRLVAWGSIVLLIGTGLTNLMLGDGWPNYQSSYGRLLMVKLIAVGLMGLLTAYHNVTAPRGLRMSFGATRWVPRASFALGLFVILFAVALARV
jgi:uncharacterized membrane protein